MALKLETRLAIRDLLVGASSIPCIVQHPKKHSNRLTKAIQYAITSLASICIPKLERKLFRIFSYSDTVFGTKADAISQLSRIVIITYGSMRAVPVLFKSYKSH